MPAGVPGESGHAVSGFDAQPLQRTGQAIDAGHHLAIGGAVNPFIALGDHLFLLVQSLNPPQDVLETQLVVLHQAFHNGHLHLSFPQRLALAGRW